GNGLDLQTNHGQTDLTEHQPGVFRAGADSDEDGRDILPQRGGVDILLPCVVQSRRFQILAGFSDPPRKNDFVGMQAYRCFALQLLAGAIGQSTDFLQKSVVSRRTDLDKMEFVYLNFLKSGTLPKVQRIARQQIADT